MTQPNEYFPESASNYSSLAAFAAKTEEDWADENKALESARWGGVNTGARGGLDPNLPLPIAIMRYVAQHLGLGLMTTLEAIAEAFQGFAANVAGAVSGLASFILKAGANTLETAGEFLKNALDGLKQTWNDLFDAFNDGSGSTDKTSSDVRERARGITRMARSTVKSGSNLVSDPVAQQPTFWTAQTRVVRAPLVRRRA